MPPSAKRPRADDEIPLPPDRATPKPVQKVRKGYHTLPSFGDFVHRHILNEFEHQPLSPDPLLDEIRVLVLHAGKPGEPIQCSFRTVSLLEDKMHTPYEALSYYWGTDQPSHSIGILGFKKLDKNSQGLRSFKHMAVKRFQIRHNLHAALENFREKDRPIYLWVDALCIDQENEEEKNQQVGKMAKIYSRAHRVCIWLGAGNPRCEEAMDFIDEIINLTSFDTLVGDEDSAKNWNSLVELMQCRWFSRRWVVQELALASDATLHYQNKTIHWTDFTDAVALFVAKFDKIKELFRYSRQFNHNPEYLGDITALGANVLVDVTSNLFRRHVKAEGLEFEPLSSLEALVSTLLSFEASDPRDTIYALLSIAKRDVSPRILSVSGSVERSNSEVVPLLPDYSKTTVEVYRDFVRFCIRTSGSLDIICRHWAPIGRKRSATLVPVGIKRKKKKKRTLNAKMPSWVSLLTESPFGDPDDALNGRVNGDSLVGHPDHKYYNAAAGMAASVEFQEIILEMTPEPTSATSTVGGHEIESVSDEALTNPDVEDTPINAFFMLVKGFQIDIIEKVSPRIASGLLLRECLIMGGYEPDDLSPDTVPDALWRTLVADRGPDGRNPPGWYRRACQNCFAHSTSTSDIDTGYLIANPRSSSIMVEFLKRVQSVVWNRTFIRSTNTGFFGLAPQGTQPGDIICIFFGCSVPVILREKKSSDGEVEYYELIGESYIYGMMDGEAIDKIFPQIGARNFKLG